MPVAPQYVEQGTNPCFQGYFQESMNVLSKRVLKVPVGLMVAPVAAVTVGTILNQANVLPSASWWGQELANAEHFVAISLNVAIGFGLFANALFHKKYSDIPPSSLLKTVSEKLGEEVTNDSMSDIPGLERSKKPWFLQIEAETTDLSNRVRGLKATEIKVTIPEQVTSPSQQKYTKEQIVEAILHAHDVNLEEAIRLALFSNKKGVLQKIKQDKSRIEVLQEKLEEGFSITQFAFDEGYDLSQDQLDFSNAHYEASEEYYSDGQPEDDTITFKMNHACGFTSGGSARGPGLAQEEIMFLEFAEPYLFSTIFSDEGNRNFLLPQDNDSFRNGQPTRPTVLMYEMTKVHFFGGAYGTAQGYYKPLTAEPVTQEKRGDCVVGVTIAAPSFKHSHAQKYTEDNLKFIYGGLIQYLEGTRLFSKNGNKKVQMGPLGCGVYLGSPYTTIALGLAAAKRAEVTLEFRGFKPDQIQKVQEEFPGADDTVFEEIMRKQESDSRYQPAS